MISLQRDQFDPKSDCFHTKKLCSRLLQKKCDFTRKTAALHFRVPLGDLGATYDYHLRLIGKRVVDFLLVFIELFSLGVTAEAILANIGSKSVILLQRGRLTQNF